MEMTQEIRISVEDYDRFTNSLLRTSALENWDAIRLDRVGEIDGNH